MAVADEDIEKALQVMGAKDVENVRDFLKNLDNLDQNKEKEVNVSYMASCSEGR